MLDKNGNEIMKGQLLFIIRPHQKNGRYFYVESVVNFDTIRGKRINKNMTFNKFDIRESHEKYLYISNMDIIEIMDQPEKFKELIRTLRLDIEEWLEEFGVLFRYYLYKGIILRAVKYTNDSYGIIANRLTHDCSEIDTSFEMDKIYVNLTYDELVKKWDIEKRKQHTEYREHFSV